MKRSAFRLALGIAVLGLTAARVTRAEPHETAASENGAPAPRVNLSLGVRFGVGSAPFYTSNFPSVHGHGFVFVPSGSYRINEALELGLTLPVAIVSIEQPAGSYVDEVTWGNPTLSATHRRTSDVGGGRKLAWFGTFGVSLPLAEHGESGALFANRALAIESALEAWREQESYFPGRLSFAPSGGLGFSTRPWKFEATLKLPLLVEVSDANLPEDAEAHAVGFAPVVHTGVSVEAFRWLLPSLSADLVVNAVPPVEGARDEISTIQFVLRPALVFPLGRGWRLEADFVAPVAGSLGGSTFSGSLLVATSF